MPQEWSNANKYNSFNSYKGLTYYERYKNILAWMGGNESLGPPVECNVDPYAECNLRCYFCITQRYLRTHREEVGQMRKLPRDYMFRLVDFLAAWGVRGLCISGGGEPTLYDEIVGLSQYAVHKGLQTAMFTNGVRMSEGLADSMLVGRFLSLSLNAVTGRVYEQIMGIDRFQQVEENMKFLIARKAQNGSKTFVATRMLILPENWHQMYDLCKWSKEIGLSAFNVRPVDFERNDIEGHRKLDLPVERINELINKCHELENGNFKVFANLHKFDEQFHVKHDFRRCLATPLLLPILTDGGAYLCVDKKMEHSYRLGSCYPDPESILTWWGSDYHRDIIKGVDTGLCSRCTFGQYNTQIENVVMEDSMCLSFP